MNYFECSIDSQNLDVKNCQNIPTTDRPINLPLEAPPWSFKKDEFVNIKRLRILIAEKTLAWTGVKN